MNDTPEVLDWLRKADSDLAAAYQLAESEPPLPDQQGFFCQQAAEKFLKAFLISAAQTPPRTHDIEVLVELCAVVEPDFAELLPLIEGLTEFAVIFRYPGEWGEITNAAQALTQAEQVREFVREKLGQVDSEKQEGQVE